MTTNACDLNDRLSKVTDAMGRVTRTTYDALGRVAAVIDNAGNTAAQYAYTANGRKSSFTNARGVVTAYAYDGVDRLAQVTYASGTGLASSESFTYDAAGNRVSHLTRKGDTVSFAYDTLNRPTGASWDNAPAAAAPSVAAVSFTHQYDKTNQRVGQTVSDTTWWYSPPASAGSTSYTANALDQYTAVGAAAPTYDGNGNLTSDGTFTYSHDAESRLTAIAQGGSPVASYGFDAQGRRKVKTVGSTVTIFVTDADNREVLEYDGSTGAILAWHAYGLGPNAVLNRMDVAAGTRATLIPDIQGSLTASLASTTGTLAKTGSLPYGENPNNAGDGFLLERGHAKASFGWGGADVAPMRGHARRTAPLRRAPWGPPWRLVNSHCQRRTRFTTRLTPR